MTDFGNAASAIRRKAVIIFVRRDKERRQARRMSRWTLIVKWGFPLLYAVLAIRLVVALAGTGPDRGPLRFVIALGAAVMLNAGCRSLLHWIAQRRAAVPPMTLSGSSPR